MSIAIVRGKRFTAFLPENSVPLLGGHPFEHTLKAQREESDFASGIRGEVRSRCKMFRCTVPMKLLRRYAERWWHHEKEDDRHQYRSPGDSYCMAAVQARRSHQTEPIPLSIGPVLIQMDMFSAELALGCSQKRCREWTCAGVISFAAASPLS